MVTIALAWSYMSFVCFVFGWASLAVLEPGGGAVGRSVPLSVLPLVGLAEIAVITGYLSLIMPIGLAANLVVLSCALALLWISRHHLGLLRARLALSLASGWAAVAVPVVVLVLLLIKSAIAVDGTLTKVFHSDTAYYHGPSIRWIAEYGVVPGLGNLLSPLAVDYLWFQPGALFGFAFLLPHRLHALMGFTAFWAFCFAWGGLRAWVGGGAGRSPSNLFRALMLFPLLELSNYIVSDSGDEPSAVFVLVAIALGCRYVERARDLKASRALFAAILILVLFSVGLKWSVLPLLVLGAVFALQRAAIAGWPSLAAVAGVGLLMLAPKLIRSVVLSGYLVYPFPGLDWFDVDWKMPAEVVAIEKSYVESMARIRFERPGAKLEGGFSDWFADWVPRFFSTPVASSLLASAALFLVVLLLRNRPVLAFLRRYRVVWLAVVLALAYWFMAAPHVRFAYGFLSAGTLLLLTASAAGIGLTTSPAALAVAGPVTDSRMVALRIRLSAAAGLLFALALLFSTPRPYPGDALGTGVAFSDFYPNRLDRMRRGKAPRAAFLFQDPYPVVETRLFPLAGLSIHRPLTGQHCWDAPLPCTPYLYRRIEGRGATLASGFRTVTGSVEAFDGRRLEEEWKQQQGLRAARAGTPGGGQTPQGR